MVESELTDGVRIAQLLASELTGRDVGVFADVGVTDADLDVEPTADGARAYDVTHAGDRVAAVYVHPDRAHVEFRTGLAAARERAADIGLRVRPKAVEPPRLLVFVKDGAEVKRAVDVFAAALQSD